MKAAILVLCLIGSAVSLPSSNVAKKASGLGDGGLPGVAEAAKKASGLGGGASSGVAEAAKKAAEGGSSAAGLGGGSGLEKALRKAAEGGSSAAGLGGGSGLEKALRKGAEVGSSAFGLGGGSGLEKALRTGASNLANKAKGLASGIISKAKDSTGEISGKATKSGNADDHGDDDNNGNDNDDLVNSGASNLANKAKGLAKGIISKAKDSAGKISGKTTKSGNADGHGDDDNNGNDNDDGKGKTVDDLGNSGASNLANKAKGLAKGIISKAKDSAGKISGKATKSGNADDHGDDDNNGNDNDDGKGKTVDDLGNSGASNLANKAKGLAKGIISKAKDSAGKISGKATKSGNADDHGDDDNNGNDNDDGKGKTVDDLGNSGASNLANKAKGLAKGIISKAKDSAGKISGKATKSGNADDHGDDDNNGNDNDDGKGKTVDDLGNSGDKIEGTIEKAGSDDDKDY